MRSKWRQWIACPPFVNSHPEGVTTSWYPKPGTGGAPVYWFFIGRKGPWFWATQCSPTDTAEPHFLDFADSDALLSATDCLGLCQKAPQHPKSHPKPQECKKLLHPMPLSIHPSRWKPTEYQGNFCRFMYLGLSGFWWMLNPPNRGPPEAIGGTFFFGLSRVDLYSGTGRHFFASFFSDFLLGGGVGNPFGHVFFWWSGHGFFIRSWTSQGQSTSVRARGLFCPRMCVLGPVIVCVCVCFKVFIPLPLRPIQMLSLSHEDNSLLQNATTKMHNPKNSIDQQPVFHPGRACCQRVTQRHDQSHSTS